MTAIKNMKLLVLLMSSFLIVALIGLAIGATGITSLAALNSGDDAMFEENIKPLGEIAMLYDMLGTQRICMSNMIMFREVDPDFSRSEHDDLAEKEAQFEEHLAAYKTGLSNNEEQKIYDDLENIYFNDFAALKQQMRAAYAADDEAEMKRIMLQIDSMGSDVSSYLDEAYELNEKLAQDHLDLNTGLFVARTWIMGVAMALGLLISIALSYGISVIITRPLGRILAAMKQVGERGCLSFPPEVMAEIKKDGEFKDEIAQLTRAFSVMMDSLIEKTDLLGVVAGGDLTPQVNLVSEDDTIGNALVKMLDSLNEMFGEIGRVTVQVSTGATQIAEGAQLLAQGTTEQAATVDHLSGSIADVAGKTSDNAQRAEKAAGLAETIKNNAEKGSGQMERMMQAVKEINEASQSIGKVIKVIDDIAFQTNILALNAAVEAARAGQHGKGFAVVADEVRNLAAKSAVAAKDTSALIANSIDKAELGTQIAGETAASLGEIVAGIVESTRIVQEIAHSSEMQSDAIVAINKGIHQVAQVVQQNSATAEQSAASSEEMSSQSAILSDLVARFSLRSEGMPGEFARALPGYDTQMTMNPPVHEGRDKY